MSDVETNGIRKVLAQSTIISDGAIWAYEKKDIKSANQLFASGAGRFQDTMQTHREGTIILRKPFGIMVCSTMSREFA